ncbi:MAG: MauE/DoxX family redox-associated membrane protein [Bacteroidota bacterium]
MSKSVNTIIRLGVSLIFIFSGLIKLSDPVGFSLKIKTYLRVFSLDFTTLFLKVMPYALALAVGVPTLEVILGIALIIKFHIKFTLRALLLLTIFFTSLTCYIAAFKRLGSCGCFGTTLPLTPWQSFSKSILLLLMLSLLYQKQKASI